MREPNNSSFLWFRDFWTCPQLPKPTTFIFGDTRTPKTNQENPQTFLKHVCVQVTKFGNSKILSFFEKMGTGWWWFEQILEILEMRSRSIKKHEMEMR